MAKGKTGNFIAAILIAIVLFFVIYFFMPEQASKFLGVKYNGASVENVKKKLEKKVSDKVSSTVDGIVDDIVSNSNIDIDKLIQAD